jgi:hypothetical protein
VADLKGLKEKLKAEVALDCRIVGKDSVLEATFKSKTGKAEELLHQIYRGMTAGDSCRGLLKRLHIQWVQITELLRVQMRHMSAFQKDQIEAEQRTQTHIIRDKQHTLYPRQFCFTTSYKRHL